MAKNKRKALDKSIPLENGNDIKDDNIQDMTVSDDEADKEELKYNSDEEALPSSNEAATIEETAVSDSTSDLSEEAKKRKKRRKIIYRTLRILFTIGFFVFTAMFLDEVLVQPYKMNKAIQNAKDLYHSEPMSSTLTPDNTDVDDEVDDVPDPEDDLAFASDSDPVSDSDSDSASDSDLASRVPATPTPTPDPNRDEMGRLKKFSNLLEINEDVKGWIRLDNINGENDTKIDYVVVQSDPSDPEYYLERAWDTHEYLKAGSIFLDVASSVERGSKNLIIHGHNMTSSDDMFHYLLRYNDLEFLKEHPLISFDTIYEEALWKVFAIYITPGNNDRDDFFPYVKSKFANNREFMEYIYQIRVRSLYKMDDIDINEEDQILTLSTCSYELKNYRTIIVARKVRKGEDPTVNTDNFEKRDPKEVLFAPSYYWRYGGKAPKVPSFETAIADGLLPWYNPMNR